MASPPAPSPIYADPPSRTPNPHALAPLPPPPKRLLARILPSSTAMSPPNSLPFPKRPSLPSLRRGPRKLSSASAASSASTKSRTSLSKREISLPSPRPDDDEDIFGSAPRRAPAPPDGGESDDSGFGDHEDKGDKETPAPVDCTRSRSRPFQSKIPTLKKHRPRPPAIVISVSLPASRPPHKLIFELQTTPAPCPSCRPPQSPAPAQSRCASANHTTYPSSTPRRTPPPSPRLPPAHAPPPSPTPPSLTRAAHRMSAALPTPYFALHPERSRPPSQQPQPQTRAPTQAQRNGNREEWAGEEQMWIPHHPYAASALSLAPSFYAGGRATPLGEMRFPLPPPPSMGGGGGLLSLPGGMAAGGPSSLAMSGGASSRPNGMLSSRPPPRAAPSTDVGEVCPGMGGYEPRTPAKKERGRLARLWTRLLSTPAPATPNPRPKTREKEKGDDEWRRTSFMDLAPAPSPLAQLSASLRRSVRTTRSAARLHVPAPSPRVSSSLSPPMSPTSPSRASCSPRVSGSLSPPMSPTSAARTSTSCVSFAFSDAREPGTPLTPVSFDVPLPLLPLSPAPASTALLTSPAPAPPVAKDYAFPFPTPIPTPIPALSRARSDSALAAEAEEDWTLALDLALSTGMLLRAPRGVVLPSLPSLPFCGSSARPESRDSKMTVGGRRGRVDSLFSVGGGCAVGGALDPWRR
ncbi:hypothetical protein HWV62_28607 [Athelia sp. TMB]|nr:hypothetical protein HWV62_28607 [Athelia sp. TMB]